MKEITCKIAQSGFCAGPVYKIEKAYEIPFSSCENIEEESAKLDKAVSSLCAALNEQSLLSSSDNAEIIKAELMLLQDEKFLSSVRNLIYEKKCCLPYALQQGSNELANHFESSESDYIRQRAADVRGLGNKLIDIVENKSSGTLSKPSVIVAEELTPQEFAELDSSKVLGLITVKGSLSGHVSIMAGNLGIPCLYQVPSLEDLDNGTYVIIDKDKVIINPDDITRKAAQETLQNLNSRNQTEISKGTSITKTKTKVYANISNAKNLDALKASGVEGVGLFRSEFLFLESDREPSEDEQYEAYSAVLDAMGEKEVIIRTMDIGSDKKASWLNMPSEKNPALGNRGVRLSLLNMDLFKIQLRALLRAAPRGNLKVMFPMISSEWEVDEIRKIVETTYEELLKDGIPCRIPPLGIMIEVPAAVLVADSLAKKVDFFSIGTNDLTQYTLALDREGEGMEAFYLPHHEAIIKLIRMTADAAHKAGIPVAICGELAADPEMTNILVDAGVDELSVSVGKIDKVRDSIIKAEKEVYMDIQSPCDGVLIPMDEIGDPVFASGALGHSVGIYPEDNTIYSPVSGKLTLLQETLHAFTIEDKYGRQILVHVGIDTVKLAGKGFEALVKKGQVLEAGQPVLRVDFDYIKNAGFNPTVITVILD